MEKKLVENFANNRLQQRDKEIQEEKAR